jgi:beta-lactamase regulating signal transducer with metallopeptidase domain
MQSVALSIGWTLSGAAHEFALAFRSLAESAAPLAVTALWQGIAVASALAICLRLAPRMSAAHRFLLWFSGFVALVCLPILPVLFSRTAAGSAGIPSGLAGAPAGPWLQLDIRWSLAIAAIWAAAAIVRAVDLAIHSLRLRKFWKTATPVDLAEITVASLACLNQLPGRRRVQVCTTRQLDRPSVIGFFAPRILIPEWLLTRLTPGELRQIVLHEAEHLRRGDDWTNLFQKLCMVLFPLNPALWWMERRLCAEREMACDDGVVRITQAPRAYAACLTSLAERGIRRRAEALSLGAWQRRPELVHRVHSILGRSQALSPMATRALFGALSCGLVFGSVELARCPQLVAFVPAHQAQVAQAHAQFQAPHLVRAAYVPVRKSSAVRASSGFRAENVKALLPTGRPVSQASLRRPATGAKELKTSFTQVASSAPSNAPKEEMLKAEMPSQETNTPQVKQPRAQQWVVLTAWEQVQISSRGVAPLSDYDSADECTDQPAANSRIQPNGQAATQSTSQPGTQITVTRLIFRVIPLNSKLNQPVPLPVRAGWLVFQL